MVGFSNVNGAVVVAKFGVVGMGMGCFGFVEDETECCLWMLGAGWSLCMVAESLYYRLCNDVQRNRGDNSVDNSVDKYVTTVVYIYPGFINGKQCHGLYRLALNNVSFYSTGRQMTSILLFVMSPIYNVFLYLVVTANVMQPCCI